MQASPVQGLSIAGLIILSACGSERVPSTPTESPAPSRLDPEAGASEAGASDEGEAAGSTTIGGGADVTAVSVSGSPGAYTFNVTVQSPDQGCNRYADFWEVVSLDGELLSRRILLHSHVNEQPFTRSGGPVEIAAAEAVIVRAHMNPDAYGGAALRGSPEAGFSPASLGADFAATLASLPPRVESCAF